MSDYNQNEQNQSACCIDFCSNYFEAEGQKLENRYKCSEKKLAAADIWRIQKSKKPVRINVVL